MMSYSGLVYQSILYHMLDCYTHVYVYTYIYIYIIQVEVKKNSKECKTLIWKSAKYSGHPPKLSATRRCDINAYTVGGVSQ